MLDGGESVAYGYITDTLDGLWYAYILNVGPDGDTLTTSTLPIQPGLSIQLVKPGSETLRVLNPFGIRARIELFDVQGCLVISENLIPGKQDVDTCELPVGLYPYRITNGFNTLASGKWLKN